MKIQSIILSLVFLLGGSGLNVDIVKCCQQLSHINLAFPSDNQPEKTDCKSCELLKKTACCSNEYIDLSIHPEYSSKVDFKGKFKSIDLKIKPFLVLSQNLSHNLGSSFSVFSEFDHHYPLPVLLKKRVLQI